MTIEINEDGTKTISVEYLARVEGEGNLHIEIKDDKLVHVQFGIFEPPRFFEAFLQGRKFTEAPDITARICGICPVAYQMGSVHAMEKACGIKVEGQLRELRRFLYAGEWIQSHILHAFLLHAPDFLNYESAIHMAKDHPEVVESALQMKKIGNDIMDLIGGRAIHPINVRVGGFYSVPTKAKMREMIDSIKRGRDGCIKILDLIKTFEFPDFEQKYEFVSLRHPDEYPMNEGRIISSGGIDIAQEEFENYFEEEHVERSTALHCVIKEGRKAYHTSPLSRYALNYDRLPSHIQGMAKDVGLGKVCSNPFRSILVRVLESIYAFEEALRIIDDYEQPDAAFVPVEPRNAKGTAITEAPRGICFHQYEIGEDGLIKKAWLMAPTSQNQKMIEEDLWKFIPEHMHLSDERLQWHCEQAIRNYDPCISCSAHFLNLTVDRS